MNRLRAYLKSYRRESILAPAFKMLEALFDLFVPLIVARMINVGIGESSPAVIKQCFFLLLALALTGLVCSFAAQYFAARAATGCAARMRRDLIAHIYALDASRLDAIGEDTLITRMTGDINQVQNGLNLFLRLFLRSPFIVFGAMIMAFAVNARVSVIFVFTILLLSVIVFTLMKRTSPMYRRIQAVLDKLTLHTRENLSGVRVIRAFGREEDEKRAFSASNASLTALQNVTGKLSALMNPLTYAAVNLGIVAVLYAGGRGVNAGALKSGDVVALVNYMSQILVELIKLANLIVTLSRAGASMSRVAAVLDTEPGMDFPEMEQSCSETDAAVEFDNVSFKYGGAGAESLTDVTFSVSAGSTVGVIGGTGSGKTTLVSLINRMYDASAGEVRLFGVPVREMTKSRVRGLVAVVPQKAQLFSGTVRSNLLMGNRTAADVELWDALEKAQAAEFVRAKPLGLDEKVSQGGRNFSGGQRQRLTIARALAKNASVLILDDSASALDFATDAALRKALNALHGRVTAFIVSQRTSSLRHADMILVLEDGRLIGKGTHAELLERCPVYREIHESQYRKEDAE
ncbi:MAG: ABC transporter ATP-binding protein [Clostridia bacterium]|nr:ABC transporter ATP-binding protein [Clostridia bacterium]